MWEMLKHAIAPAKNTPATAISEFYYPRRGFGMIPAALEREILDMGGMIHTSATLLACEPIEAGFQVSVVLENGVQRTINADCMVSSIPVNALLQSIPEHLGSHEILAQSKLEYRDLICLMIALKKEQVSTDSWTYFPHRNLMFGRTHEPKNWSPEMVPDPSYTSLAIEIFSSRGESSWTLPDDEILKTVVDQMDQIGWIKKADVHKSWVLRVPYAYPVYRKGYAENLTVVKDYLSQWSNLHLVGRTGSFHYMNSDGVIEDVFRLIEELFPQEAIAVQPLIVSGRWM